MLQFMNVFLARTRQADAEIILAMGSANKRRRYMDPVPLMVKHRDFVFATVWYYSVKN